MDVEVDVYSGRENPRFRLDRAAAAEISRRLDGLPPSSGPRAVRDGLGYRGLRLTGAGRGPGEIIVSDGAVLLRGGTDDATWRDDHGRSLERRLVELGAGTLDPELLALLRADLGGDGGDR